MRLNNVIKLGSKNNPATMELVRQVADTINKTGTAVISEHLNMKHEKIEIDIKELVLRNMEILEILVKAEVNQPVMVNVAQNMGKIIK